LIPPTVPEVRRVIRAMAGPEEEREFRLAWSLWRRAHQAVAKRSHAARRALRRVGASPPSHHASRETTATVPEPIAAPLTDEKWECIKPLMPPQKPPTGRPRRDHRQVLRGMLWIFGTGASWRDLPEEEFGPWRTVYGRYRQWQEQGLWRRIVKVLQLGDDATNF
jgi:putative transposase of IS4/5 family DUF4096